MACLLVLANVKARVQCLQGDILCNPSSNPSPVTRESLNIYSDRGVSVCVHPGIIMG